MRLGVRDDRVLERRPFDSSLDQHVDRTAGHDEMLYSIAANEDELAVRINRRRLHHAKRRSRPRSRLVAFRPVSTKVLNAQAVSAISANANRKAATPRMILSVSVIEDISGFLSASAGGRWPAAEACWPPNR
jgi:hypothetical protein